MNNPYYDPDTVSLQFKYYQWLVGLFAVFYILTNVLAVKVCQIYYFTFLAGMLTYPVSYSICDIVTEVYGFQRARQLVYFGALSAYVFVVFVKIADALPAQPGWNLQDAFHQTLNGTMPRILLASTLASIVGDFVNCKVIAKLKTKMKYGMWFRFVSATAIGALVDNTVFTLLVFGGRKEISWIAILLINQYSIKLSYSAIFSLVTVRISRVLKRLEKTDIYDNRTNFSPFQLSITYTQKDNYYGRRFP